MYLSTIGVQYVLFSLCCTDRVAFMPQFYDNGPDRSERLLLCSQWDAFTLCSPILKEITADKKTVDLQDGGTRDTTA